jgi:vanillate O-demethylase monooxygenase subunit
MFLQVDIALAGSDRPQTTKAPQVHLFTPASDKKTYYFYAMCLPKAVGPLAQEIADRNVAGLRGPFVAEDKPMVEAVQRNMGDRAFWGMKPVLLEVDAPAVRARRVLDRLIAQEQAATAAASASPKS